MAQVLTIFFRRFQSLRPAQKQALSELLWRYDEPETLSYQIRLAGAIGADVRHEGSIMPLFTRPFAATFFAISVISLLWPMYSDWKKAKAKKATAAAE